MSDGTPDQLGFKFDVPQQNDGLKTWREQRMEAHRRLARELGLPLDHVVEVWLRGNIRLRGTLRLCNETLFVEEVLDGELELEVDGVPFTPGEMESCVRMD